MYSGGFGYFEQILPQFEQDSSYFALQNEHWLLVGLDTAYVDHDIDTTQVAWLNLVIEQAEPGRKVVLFSHQQPFSRLSGQGPKLQNALRAPAGRQAHHGLVLGPRAPVRDLRPSTSAGACTGAASATAGSRSHGAQRSGAERADERHPGVGDVHLAAPDADRRRAGLHRARRPEPRHGEAVAPANGSGRTAS